MRRLLLILLLIGFGCSREQEVPVSFSEVSWSTLLSNVWKLEPQLFTASELFSSSSGPVSLTGYSPVKYGDLDHGTFLDIRTVAGGYEAVLAEADGPGAITWIWSANPVGELLVEVDGETSVYSFQSFLLGKWLPAKTAFASKTAGGFNLHFPIVHRKHCRLTLRVKSREELGALFYQVAWNRIETKKEIKPFDPGRIAESRTLLQQISRHWKAGRSDELGPISSRTIKPTETANLLWTMGRGGFQCLELSAGSKKELSGLHIEMYWDGEKEPSLSCPLYLLCGVSEHFEDIQSVPITVRGSVATIRWPMPFHQGAKVNIRNTGRKEVAVGVAASMKISRNVSGTFCGRVSSHWKLPLSGPNVLALATVPTAGRFVGCNIQVANHGSGWWGEGDPLIHLNGSDKPGWRGTGTEDYFGFAWCSDSRFQHPLRAQVRPGVLSRYHLLDTLPFSAGARFGFEAHGTGDGFMDYSALVLWYEEMSPMKSDMISK
ncbi:DUF2961 domain-containing protein [Pontiellaceae bacterium B12227]|nr:DUF2961 domain-containing protein [Pontiellaceae bacterium B12227]